VSGRRRIHPDVILETASQVRDSLSSFLEERRGHVDLMDIEDMVRLEAQWKRRKAEEKHRCEIYSTGLFHCSVCTNMKDKDKILTLVNEIHPCGTEPGWTFSRDTQWAAGGDQPAPCPDKPGFTHYLMDA
jgi:hypothetical protein